MTVTTPGQERAERLEATTTTGGSLAQRHGPDVLGWRDLMMPIFCALVCLVIYVYVQRQDLGTIEQNLLDPDKLEELLIDHVQISAVIVALVLAIAVPLGILVTRRRTRFLAPLVLLVANFGQAAPSIGLLAIAGSYVIGFWTVVLVLTGYAALSVLRNTIVGLQQVDDGVLDAARGMGMSPLGVLLKVELPLAVPVIAAGARIAVVLAVATVPLGYDLGAGGLGELFIGGFKLNRPVAVVVGAGLTAVLALILDWLGGIVARALTPRGIR